MYPTTRNSVMLAVILCSFWSLGQPARKPTVSSNKPPEATAALSNQKQHALGTITQLFGISKGLTDAAASIRIGSQIADILWDYDQPRAREYFMESLGHLDSIQSAESATGLSAGTKSQLRRELLGRIARRDPAMAERILQTYIKSEKKDQTDPSLSSSTATNMAANDLQRAIAVLRRGMQGGITAEFVTSLRVIRESAPATANDLFYEAMTQAAANDDEAFGRSLPLLASYVFQAQSGVANSSPVQDTSNPEPDSGGNTPASTENPAAPAADGELINNFLNFTFQALLPQESLTSRGPSGPGLPAYVALLQLLPYYQQYLPQQASVIVNGFNQLAAAIQDPAKRALLVNLVGQVTPNQIVQAGASLANSDEKDIVYHRASLQSARQDNIEQALSIAGSIRNEKLRQDAESVARTRAADLALSRGDLDTAYAAILSIPLLRQQAAMFAQMMRLLVGKKDIVRAGQVLDGATRVIEKAHDTPDKVRALLLLFEVSTQIDGSRETTILQLAVSAMNRSDWAESGKRDAAGTSLFSDSKRGEAAKSVPWFNFQGSFGRLARTDFDNALALAQSVRQQELSIIAQLAACQGILMQKTRRQQDL